MRSTELEPRDIVINNALIRTQDHQSKEARSVRIRRGRIVEVGPEDSSPAGARVINADGATILPGFNDVHAHSTWFGLTKLELDVSQADSVEELYNLVADRASLTPPGEWVVATGFNHIRLGERYPDKDSLDRASGGRPVWLKHNSGHAAFVSATALEAITFNSPIDTPIEGGHVVRDAAGRPTGLLEENAMGLVQNLMLPYPIDTIVDALEAATLHYVSEGITSVTDAGIGGGWIGHSPREFRAYQEAHASARMHTRMQPMFAIDALHSIPGHRSEAEVLSLDGGIHTGFGDDWLRLGPVKIFSDGSLLGSTASMTIPYEGCPGHHGYLQEPAESLRDRAMLAYAGGWSLAIHAIGDQAVDHAISIIGEVQARYGKRQIPNRIEHAGVVREDQLPTLAKLGIAVTPQPNFIREFGDAMMSRVGSQREAQLYRARSFLKHGITLPGSSDRPVANGRPLSGIQSFVERRSSSGTVIGSEESLTVAEALAAYTIGSARATGQETHLGSITPGKFADLTILEDDPLSVAPARIGDIKVAATMVDGNFVHGWE